MASTRNSRQYSNAARRSANYQPSIWHFDYIQSLKSQFKGESYAKQVNKLKEEVRVMLEQNVEEPLAQLEHIDLLQRLGLSCHFEGQIHSILKSIYCNKCYYRIAWNNNLYATALAFRLLRQHGYRIPQEVFCDFKDDSGNFKACICDDTEGMLSLYEASHLCVEGENVLEEARDFATQHLQEYMKNQSPSSSEPCKLVKHALKLPLHWRMVRLETRWFIDVYESRKDMNPILLQLAKLDFNVVQSTHQEDLKQASRWWRSTGLGQNLCFARDRLMESFFWGVGMTSEPEFGNCRTAVAKMAALVTVTDDIYDVYGILEELELYTDAVERWDVNALERLPYYMKFPFVAVHNFVNEMANDVLKEQGLDILKYLKKTWVDLCKSYLREAEWYYRGYTPTLQEYIDNAWISIGGPVALVHTFFVVTNPITEEALQCLEECPNLIRWSSTILRLANDLGTSSHELKRGDVLKSIQCYMNETGAPEDDAREHIKGMISETWKKMNQDAWNAKSRCFSKTYIGIAMNLARTAQCIYQHGDGYGVNSDRETKDQALALFIKPIV